MPARGPLPGVLFEPLLRAALAEDLGAAGDLTTDAIVPPDEVTVARFVARAAGVASGVTVALRTFTLLDPAVHVDACVTDGDAVEPGTVLAVVHGPARAVLTGERVALNLLGRLCGIASATAAMVTRVGDHGARIVPTRKTTPGLRALERAAVRAGGGIDHRFGLHDGVLIKDNHIAVAGDIATAVSRARAAVGHMVRIEVEVDTLAQLDEALGLGVDAVLLDNMSLGDLRAAVARVPAGVVTEASGGVTPDAVADIAATGVDLISTGWLTHSAPALDIGLDIAPGS
jgi:nicotinate-nucleotide pyrophosphorylase (carboxylating)